MGRDIGRQFTQLGDAPILIHTLRKFAASYPVSDIYVAMRRNEMEGFRKAQQEQGAEATITACDVAERSQLEGLLAGVPKEHPLGAGSQCLSPNLVLPSDRR